MCLYKQLKIILIVTLITLLQLSTLAQAQDITAVLKENIKKETTKKVAAAAASKTPSDAPAPPSPPTAPPAKPVFIEDPPLGFAGPKSIKSDRPPTDEEASGDFVPVDDRWRIGFPDWDRHGDFSKADYPFTKGRLINPYRQNVLKGDYPVIGYDKFFALTLTSETFINVRRIPLASDVSAQRPDSREFFGRTGLFLFNQNFKVTGDFYQGDASFKPADWRLHTTLVFNVNYAHARENVVLRIDPRRGNTRRDGIVSLQEAFGEYRLGDTTKVFPFLRGRGSKKGYSPFYDTTSFRAGIQCFNSDFRGFIYNDCDLGARLFGNFASNRYQFNLVYLKVLTKDTNSGLNTFDSRFQDLIIANVYRQDTIKKGYTVQFSYHHNRDSGRNFNDQNGFPVRPAVVGTVVPHEIRTHYFGLTTDGHFGERLPRILGLNKIGGGLNLSTAFYQVLGKDTFNGLAGRPVDVNAQLAAAELSVDRDFMRFRTTFLYSSGDDNPTDGSANGFDSILDNNNFAGGQFSFFNSVTIPALNSTLQLINQNSLIPSLRSSKTAGQANHVNPGLFLYNLGLDVDITQKLRFITDVNFVRFATTAPLELLLMQPKIEKNLGIDYHAGVKYRPYLNDNMIIFAGAAVFRPGAGFTSIYGSQCQDATSMGLGCGRETGNKTLFNLFATIKLTY